MQVINSFWFWLVIIGLLLILTAILIGGGMKEIKGWTWAIFILGAVLGLLGIIFAIIAWSKYTPCGNECGDLSACDKPIKMTITSPLVSKTNTPMNSPIYSNPGSAFSSPIGTPTKVTTNIPQAKRGFTASSLELSSLSAK